jgi:hypothetical protein
MDIMRKRLAAVRAAKRPLPARPKFVQKAVLVLEKHLLAISNQPLDGLSGPACLDPGVVFPKGFHEGLSWKQTCENERGQIRISGM